MFYWSCSRNSFQREAHKRTQKKEMFWICNRAWFIWNKLAQKLFWLTCMGKMEFNLNIWLYCIHLAFSPGKQTNELILYWERVRVGRVRRNFCQMCFRLETPLDYSFEVELIIGTNVPFKNYFWCRSKGKCVCQVSSASLALLCCHLN